MRCAPSPRVGGRDVSHWPLLPRWAPLVSACAAMQLRARPRDRAQVPHQQGEPEGAAQGPRRSRVVHPSKGRGPLAEELNQSPSRIQRAPESLCEKWVLQGAWDSASPAGFQVNICPCQNDAKSHFTVNTVLFQIMYSPGHETEIVQ